jgi:DNA-binding transcriptional LysR family regulator
MLLQQFCREHGGFEPRLEYPTDDVAMAQPLIAAGLAVALLPSLNLAHPHPGVTVRQLPHAHPGAMSGVSGQSNKCLPAATAMISTLAQAATRGVWSRVERVARVTNGAEAEPLGHHRLTT